MHPPLPAIGRQCTKNFNIPDTNIVIEKGTSIFFSVSGLQSDPKYYESPEKFVPERHSDAGKKDKCFDELPNLTFGLGPRNCIGMRISKLISKIGIISLIRKFKFELADEHKNSCLKSNPRDPFFTTPLNGVNLKVFFR